MLKKEETGQTGQMSEMLSAYNVGHTKVMWHLLAEWELKRGCSDVTPTVEPVMATLLIHISVTAYKTSKESNLQSHANI